MVSKELLEKVKKCTSKEEILELAKKENIEVSDSEISYLLGSSNATNKELSDEELENVTGGSCSSSETYNELGIPWSRDYQFGWNHPIIVTSFNTCSIGYDYCCHCGSSEWSGAILYCKSRSKENDPCNGGVKYDWDGNIIQHY